jgi:hypothetical protein
MENSFGVVLLQENAFTPNLLGAGRYWLSLVCAMLKVEET